MKNALFSIGVLGGLLALSCASISARADDATPKHLSPERLEGGSGTLRILLATMQRVPVVCSRPVFHREAHRRPPCFLASVDRLKTSALSQLLELVSYS